MAAFSAELMYAIRTLRRYPAFLRTAAVVTLKDIGRHRKHSNRISFAVMSTRASISVILVVLTLVPGITQAPTAPRMVAFTFDDLPGGGGLLSLQQMTAKLLKTLTAEQVPATGFVNEANLFTNGEIEARALLLDAWLDAGFDLGNHTYSHRGADSVAFETYKADLIKGEVVTRRLLEARGRRLRYFRHPSLRTGPTAEYKTALDALLAERGYRVAPVTIDHNDFMFAEVYARARAASDGETMERVVRAYVPYLESVVVHFESLSRQFLGYELKQTFILHANQLNADHVGDVIRMLRNRGYAFITLDAALEDPAYQLPDMHVPRGLSWLHRWMLAKGLPMQPEPSEPMFIRELFTTARR
jgi:peptidoglycan/xylan/chitin deacetylase (PgdA/CDA1 family)